MVGVALALGAAAAGLLRAWPLINVVETGRTPEYPDIQPRRYAADPSRVFDAALHAISVLPRWSLVRHDEAAGEIRAESTTRVMRFVDDVTVRIQPQDRGTIVNARSASRVGRGDFGQNARNLRAFFEELDRQLNVPGH
jgi:uncharacterized protein (DUF1499 family)